MAKPRDIPTKLPKLVKPYCIAKGKGFRLKDVDPGDTLGLTLDHESAQKLLKEGVQRMAELQELLYAEKRWALLVVFQAMDAAGKDSAIKHVMSGLNPQGCDVHSFRAPAGEELEHDYMWRCLRYLPQRGRIGIFNRSYYEEVLAVRVHPEFLARQRIPPELVGKDIWKQRFEDIDGLERYLARNGIRVCKFFLHVSKAEQKRRLLARLERPDKHWKFSPDDLAERRLWPDYMAAYEDMVRSTATEDAPWHVVPADNKWFTRLVVAAAIIQVLESLDLSYPKIDARVKRQIAAARRVLERE
jgi:PPK2 family polyphosphate:nucleotide phosphotransferase